MSQIYYAKKYDAWFVRCLFEEYSIKGTDLRAHSCSFDILPDEMLTNTSRDEIGKYLKIAKDRLLESGNLPTVSESRINEMTSCRFPDDIKSLSIVVFQRLGNSISELLFTTNHEKAHIEVIYSHDKKHFDGLNLLIDDDLYITISDQGITLPGEEDTYIEIGISSFKGTEIDSEMIDQCKYIMKMIQLFTKYAKFNKRDVMDQLVNTIYGDHADFMKKCISKANEKIAKSLGKILDSIEMMKFIGKLHEFCANNSASIANSHGFITIADMETSGKTLMISINNTSGAITMNSNLSKIGRTTLKAANQLVEDLSEISARGIDLLKYDAVLKAMS